MDLQSRAYVYEQFFSFLEDHPDVIEFERWFYQNDEAVFAVSSTIHEELLFNFSDNQASGKLSNLIYQYIDLTEYNSWLTMRHEAELRKILTGIYTHSPDWIQLSDRYYNYFWDDGTRYAFLNVLADIGAFLYYSPEYMGLPPQNETQRMKLQEAIIYPKAQTEAIRILKWLDSGQIQITGPKECTDHRSSQDKTRRVFEEIKQEIRVGLY